MQRFCIALLVLFLGVGCSTSSTLVAPEEVVAIRAQERVDALLAGDLDKSMEYTTPGFRQANSRNQYGARYAGATNWTEAKVEQVTCEGDRCDVSIQVSYQMARPRITNTRALDEVWIQVDGQWYIYL